MTILGHPNQLVCDVLIKWGNLFSLAKIFFGDVLTYVTPFNICFPIAGEIFYRTSISYPCCGKFELISVWHHRYHFIDHDDVIKWKHFPRYWPHDDVIKWKHFPRYWPFVRGIHRSPVNSLHKGQWRRALMSSLISARINSWVNNREAGNLRRIRPHYNVTVMICAGNSLVPIEFPAQRPVTQSIDVFFDLRLNKRLSKQSRGWWFEMPGSPLWRPCNDHTAILGRLIYLSIYLLHNNWFK